MLDWIGTWWKRRAAFRAALVALDAYARSDSKYASPVDCPYCRTGLRVLGLKISCVNPRGERFTHWEDGVGYVCPVCIAARSRRYDGELAKLEDYVRDYRA